MTEIFKDIEGYEGLYQVSNLGRVKSLYDGRHKIFREKILKPLKTRKGYNRVALCKNGELKYITIHRLVAKAFVPNPKNLPEVNHKDENKTNNSAENLEWVTGKENVNFGTRNLRIAKKLSKKVYQYTKSGDFVREWPSTQEIERQLGFNHGYICNCCTGKCQSAYGFVWRYSSSN